MGCWSVEENRMNILIYGAGVIGSLYAVLFSEAGVDVSIYARGKRLENLLKKGLLYKKDNQIRTAKVTVVSKVQDDDLYDLPAFPGAGGGIENNVLDAALTPRIIQPTTLGRTDGREKKLAAVFKRAGIPFQVVEDMHTWQICHLGMVVPIADAYYESEDPKNCGSDHEIDGKAFQIIHGWHIDRLRFLGKVVDANKNKWPYKLFEKLYAKYERQVREHQAKGEWTDTWGIKINPDNRTEGYSFHLIGCPIAKHAKEHGYEELLPYLCKTDHSLAHVLHGKDVKTVIYPHGSHLNGLMPNREREKKLYRMIPIIGLMYKTFGKYKKDNLSYFEKSEKEIIDWIS